MRILRFLYMVKQKIKKKYVFVGDTDSINIELISKSFNYCGCGMTRIQNLTCHLFHLGHDQNSTERSV